MNLSNVLMYFDDMEWKYTIPKDGEDIAVMGVSTDNGNFQCLVDVSSEHNGILFLTIFPANVPPDMRDTIAGFLTRINYGLFFGNFEMNYESGEIRFRTSLCPVDDFKKNEFDQLIGLNIQSMDRYFKILNNIIFGHLAIEDAVASLDK